jgi:hypothetical protein
MSARIEELWVEKYGEKKGVWPNVDFYSASVYYYMGIPLDLYTRFLPSAVSLDGQLMCLNSYQITEFTDQGLNISVQWIKFMFRLISDKKKRADLNRPFFYFVLEKFAKR